MNNKAKKFNDFKGKVSQKQIINNLIAKNLKGGGDKCPPPFE